MNFQPNKKLFKKLTAKGFTPEHVSEVGVYIPESSNIYDYIKHGIRTTLVEPDPKSIKRIEAIFGNQPNVTLHPVAAFDFNGPLQLADREASTFVSTLEASPAIVNDGYVVDDNDCFTVDSVTFDRIDDGTIDLISIDTEGSEWFVLKYMSSLPAVISIESHGAAYTNPYLAEIRDWMRDKGYVLFYRDKSDSVYVQPDTISLTLLDKGLLWLENQALSMRRSRKRLFNPKNKSSAN